MPPLVLRGLLAASDAELNALRHDNFFVEFWYEQGAKRQHIVSAGKQGSFVQTFLHRGVIHSIYDEETILNTLLVCDDFVVENVKTAFTPMCSLVALYNSICNLHPDQDKIPTPSHFLSLISTETINMFLQMDTRLIEDEMVVRVFNELKTKLPIVRESSLAIISNNNAVCIYDGIGEMAYIQNLEITQMKDLDTCLVPLVFVFCGVGDTRHFRPVQRATSHSSHPPRPAYPRRLLADVEEKQPTVVPERLTVPHIRNVPQSLPAYLAPLAPLPLIRKNHPAVRTSSGPLIYPRFDNDDEQKSAGQISTAFDLLEKMRTLCATARYLNKYVEQLESAVMQLQENLSNSDEIEHLFGDCKSVIIAHTL